MDGVNKISKFNKKKEDRDRENKLLKVVDRKKKKEGGKMEIKCH